MSISEELILNNKAEPSLKNFWEGQAPPPRNVLNTNPAPEKLYFLFCPELIGLSPAGSREGWRLEYSVVSRTIPLPTGTSYQLRNCC